MTCSFCKNPPIVRVAAASPIDPRSLLCWYHNATSVVHGKHKIVLADGQPDRPYVSLQRTSGR